VRRALRWLANERAALRTGDLGCWTDDRRFTGWRLAASADPEPAALPALLLKRAGREWAVRFGRRDHAGWIRIAIGDRSERAMLEPLGADLDASGAAATRRDRQQKVRAPASIAPAARAS
jgi:hypothetical protein